MTRQQAGVSAEAVAKLVERFRSRCAVKGGCQDSRDPEKCSWCTSADELEALATAPPEQGSPRCTCPPAQELFEKHVETCPLAAAPPQAVSAEELDDSFAQIIKDLREAKVDSPLSVKRPLKKALNWIADRIERLLEVTPIIHGQAELAAHDQKVRAEVCEAAAQVVKK